MSPECAFQYAGITVAEAEKALEKEEPEMEINDIFVDEIDENEHVPEWVTQLLEKCKCYSNDIDENVEQEQKKYSANLIIGNRVFFLNLCCIVLLNH